VGSKGTDSGALARATPRRANADVKLRMQRQFVVLEAAALKDCQYQCLPERVVSLLVSTEVLRDLP